MANSERGTGRPQRSFTASMIFRAGQVVERAGNQVGPNNVSIANRLWALAEDIRAMADEYDGRNR